MDFIIFIFFPIDKGAFCLWCNIAVTWVRWMYWSIFVVWSNSSFAILRTLWLWLLCTRMWHTASHVFFTHYKFRKSRSASSLSAHSTTSEKFGRSLYLLCGRRGGNMRLLVLNQYQKTLCLILKAPKSSWGPLDPVVGISAGLTGASPGNSLSSSLALMRKRKLCSRTPGANLSSSCPSWQTGQSIISLCFIIARGSLT